MQETIFGALFDPEDDRVLSVGDEVWRVTIDVVERFVVDGDFECEDYRAGDGSKRSEEHTSELQSRCRGCTT